MILYLDGRKEREGWLKIYRKMQVKYHVGLVLGLLSIFSFTNGACYIKKYRQ